MPFVIIGVLLLLAKFAEFGPTADWPWWAILLPFGAAVAWWGFADSTGITQRRAMQKMEDRKVERREKAMEALGRDTRREKRVERARSEAKDRQQTVTRSTPEVPSADPTRRDH
jgi:small Trp-rich protein